VVDSVRHAYGKNAPLYIEVCGDISTVHAGDLDLIERHLGVGTGAVLDVGCGPGHLTAHLQSLGVGAIGIDVTSELLDHARVAHPDVAFGLASMDRLPVHDRSVDGILAWYSLIHLAPDDLDGVLDELRRVVVPGGTLVVGFFDGEVISPFDHRVVQAYYWPIEELSARLDRAGFSEVERQQRPGAHEPGRRPHAAIVAVAR